MLKIAVAVLAVLAGVKIWAHEHFYRSATREALINAYQERALLACQRWRMTAGQPRDAAMPDGQAGEPKIELVIGDSSLSVAFWDVGNPQWRARHKTPYLQISLHAEGRELHCMYDISNGSATAKRS